MELLITGTTLSKANLCSEFLEENYLETSIRLTMVTTQISLIDDYLFTHLEIGEFQKIVGGFIDMVDSLAKEVEKEKMKVRPSISCQSCTVYIYMNAPSFLGDSHIILSSPELLSMLYSQNLFCDFFPNPVRFKIPS